MAKKSPIVALTGGGSAGHVMLHLAILDDMLARGWSLYYVGSQGIERNIIAKTGLPFFTISSGKMRRYASLQNFFDVFKVMLGFFQCVFLLLRKRPDVVFSKGGFVSVPVVLAAWILRIPVISHESDVTPGLANRIAGVFAEKILYSFPQTKDYLPKGKSQYVGAVVRPDLFKGDRRAGLALCGFDPLDSRKIILVLGGSQGAQRINEAIDGSLAELLKSYRVIHITGAGKMLNRAQDRSYVAFEFVGEGLKDIFAAADLVITRAGSNTIFECLALHKPMLLIPLESGSRGDQLINAQSFEKSGWAILLRESGLSTSSLVENVEKLNQLGEHIRQGQGDVPADKARHDVLQAVAVVGKFSAEPL